MVFRPWVRFERRWILTSEPNHSLESIVSARGKVCHPVQNCYFRIFSRLKVVELRIFDEGSENALKMKGCFFCIDLSPGKYTTIAS